MLNKPDRIIVRFLGMQPYVDVWTKMQAFTNDRTEATVDELWLVQHPPVFTQGQAGKAEHVLAPGDIPVVKTDRGGQITYHGPGQVVAYPLLNLRRLDLGVRALVEVIESAVVEYLQQWGVQSAPKPNAPGVYVDGNKIASLGLRVRRGCSFHGVSVNIAMDLEPFQRINPCGYDGLQMAQLCDLVDAPIDLDAVEREFAVTLASRLGFSDIQGIGSEQN